MRRNVGSGGGSFGFGNNGIGPSPNQLSPAMMEELMRRQVTAAGNSQGGASMPALPFYGTDIIRRQQEGWGGEVDREVMIRHCRSMDGEMKGPN